MLLKQEQNRCSDALANFAKVNLCTAPDFVATLLVADSAPLPGKTTAHLQTKRKLISINSVSEPPDNNPTR